MIEHVDSLKCISSTILLLTLRLPELTHFLCVHAPHAESSSEDRDAFYNTLTNTVQQLGRRTIIVGDYNAVIRPNVDGPYGYTGRLSTSTTVAADDLEIFIRSHDLRALASHHRLPNHYTFLGTNGRRAPLDHLLYTSDFTFTQHHTVVRASRGPIPSDHRWLYHCLPLSRPPHRTPPPRRPPPPDVQLLQQEAYRVRFISVFQSLFPPDCADYAMLVAACSAASGALPPVTPIRRTALRTHAQMVQQRERVRTAKSLVTMRAEFRALLRLREDLRNEDVSRLCAIVDENLRTDSRTAFSVARMLCRQPRPIGNITAPSTQDRLQLIRDTCAKQLQNPLGDPHIRFRNVPGLTPDQYNTDPFTPDELQYSLNKMRNHRAPGPDGIRNEYLKVIGGSLLPLMNAMLAGATPSTVKQTVLAMIPKSNGNLSTPKGWRFIALLNTIVKLFNRLLLERIRPRALPRMRPNQCGFLPRRSTLQQIIALKLLVQDFNFFKHFGGEAHGVRSLVLTFIDFSNAFPSVSWPAIRAALRAFSVPTLLVDAIMNIYTDHTAWVRSLTDLDYADDIALISRGMGEAQITLLHCQAIALSAGLEMNASKTKYIVLGRDRQRPPLQWRMCPSQRPRSKRQ